MSAHVTGEGTAVSSTITGDLWSAFLTTVDNIEDQIHSGAKVASVAFTDICALGPGGLATWKSHLEASLNAELFLSVNVMANLVNIAVKGSFPTDDHQPSLKAVGTIESSAVSSSSACSNKSMAKVPRPLNAFILYRRDLHSKVVAEHPGLRNNEISQIIGKKWQSESRVIKEDYQRKAKEAKAQHAIDHPDYQYKPRKPSEKKKRMTKAKLSAVRDLASANNNGLAVNQIPQNYHNPLAHGPSIVQPSVGIPGGLQVNIGDEIDNTLRQTLKAWSTAQKTMQTAAPQFPHSMPNMYLTDPFYNNGDAHDLQTISLPDQAPGFNNNTPVDSVTAQAFADASDAQYASTDNINRDMSWLDHAAEVDRHETLDDIYANIFNFDEFDNY